MPSLSEDRWLFVRKFIQHPKQVGSIAPSSRYLAEEMLRPVPWDDIGALAELGAGTGAITRAIARRVRPGTKVYLFEKDARMRRRLAEAYPAFECAADASRLLDVLAAGGRKPLDCVISGLPFYNFPEPLRVRLLGQIEGALKPNGLFVAFQYSLQMKSRFARVFELDRVAFEPLNLPPAFVYICRKRGADRP